MASAAQVLRPTEPTTGATNAANAASPAPWLADWPVSSFAMVMGLGGLANCWTWAGMRWPLFAALAPALLWLASGLFVWLLALQLVRGLCHPAALRAEFLHPMKAAFFASVSVAMLVLAIGWRQAAPGWALGLWWGGSTGQLILALLLMRRWILQAQDEQLMTPAWFIPVVGNLLVPVAGVPLGQVAISHFFFSVGLCLWGAFFVIALHRVLFVPAMSARSLPTLFIWLAPPSVGYLAAVALGGTLPGALAPSLLHLALFMALLLAILLPRLLRGRFFLSWWALTFPSCAWATAVLRHAAGLTMAQGRVNGMVDGMVDRPAAVFWAGLCVVALTAATGLVTMVALRSLRHVASGAWRREEAVELPPASPRESPPELPPESPLESSTTATARRDPALEFAPHAEAPPLGTRAECGPCFLNCLPTTDRRSP